MFSLSILLFLGMTVNPEAVNSPGVSVFPSVEVSSVESVKANNSSQVQVSSIIRQGTFLERNQRCEEAAKFYSAALRKYPGSQELQAQYSRVKILCDIHKRFGSAWYTSMVRNYNPSELRQFVQVFWNVFFQNYCEPFPPGEVFNRELSCLEIALKDRFFWNHVQPEVNPVQVQAFLREIHQYAKEVSIQSPRDLTPATLEIGSRFQNRFGRDAAFLVMEGLFDFVVSLDAYSEVLLPSQYQNLLTTISGSTVGVGISIENVEGETEIVSIVPHSPAESAGLYGGLKLVAVDGASTKGLTMTQVSEQLDGPMDSCLKLLVRSPQGELREVTLIREPINILSVEQGMMLKNADGIGYVKLTGFQQTSEQEMRQTLMRLQGQGMKSLIIDLRGNPGGTVDSAVALSELFLDQGTILEVKSSRYDFTYQAHPRSVWSKIPLVILVDAESASAAEIFAGAIQGQKRGMVVGTRSYGKGSIQSMLPIGGTPLIMKLTTAHFYDPNGNRYNYVGVNPDYSVRVAGKVMIGDVTQDASSLTVEGEENDPVIQKAMEVLASRGVSEQVSMK